MFLYNDLRQLYNIGKLIVRYNIISFNQAVDYDFFSHFDFSRPFMDYNKVWIWQMIESL